MNLNENTCRVLLTLASDMAIITQTPDGLLVTAKAEVRSGWARMMLVGLLSPFDGVFDLCNAITIPRSHLPPNFSLTTAPDEAVALSYAESRTQAPAEPVAVKLSQKEVYINQLRENFKPRMATATVSQAVKFLMSKGITADEIIAATGVSEATLYRSLRLSAKTSPAPEAVT